MPQLGQGGKRLKLIYLIHFLTCFLFATSAVSNTDNGILIKRWNCFSPVYYKCTEFTEFDRVLERITGWDSEFRKETIASFEYEDYSNCSQFLHTIAVFVASDVTKNQDKRTIASNIAAFLLRNQSHAEFTDMLDPDILFPVIKAFNFLNFVTRGGWPEIASREGNDLAQCVNAVDRLKEKFEIKDRNDVTWRTVYNLTTLFTLDVLNQRVHHSDAVTLNFDLEIALYWLKQSAKTNVYAGSLWKEVGHLYKGTLD